MIPSIRGFTQLTKFGASHAGISSAAVNHKINFPKQNIQYSHFHSSSKHYFAEKSVTLMTETTLIFKEQFESAIIAGDSAKTNTLLSQLRSNGIILDVNFFRLAISKGNESLARELAPMFPLDVTTDDQGQNPLHWAIRKRRPEMVQMLIDLGASPTMCWKLSDGTHVTPIEMAAVAGSPKIFEIILEKNRTNQIKINLLREIPRLGTILHACLKANQGNMVEYLLNDHFDKIESCIERTDAFGRTPMQLAAFLGDLFAINLLHRKKATVNRGVNETGGTAVHYAADGEKPEALLLLHHLGYKLDATDINGYSAKVLIKDRKSPKAMQCRAILSNQLNVAMHERTLPPNFKDRPPTNLAIQGGSTKGIAYVGLLRRMEQYHLLKELERVSGTSAGAIFGSLIATGHSSNDIERILESLDFKHLLDTQGKIEESLLHFAEKKTYTDAKQTIKTILKEYYEGLSTLLHPKEYAKKIIEKLNSITGLCHGDLLEKEVEKYIAEATEKKYCTFSELRKLINENPQQFKHLHIFAIHIRKGMQPEILEMSSEDTNWDDCIISSAVRGSASIPIAFKPHILQFKNKSGHFYTRKNFGEVIDGGLLYNYPLKAFDEKKYQEDRCDHGYQTNRRTLGFCLEEIAPPAVEDIQKLETTAEVAQALIATFFHAEEIIRKAEGDDGRSIKVPVKHMGIFDSFKLTDDDRKEMIGSAESAFDSFFFPS
jgi:predicted acylesterase/phospholipase RssA/ankyrin repeat protein